MYKRMTLAEVIAELRTFPEGAEVTGLGDDIYSYRGYYDRNAVEPLKRATDAHALADKYEKQIGKPTQGWKGGDYKVDPDKLLYPSYEGDTGPSIIGFRQDPVDDTFEPVLLAEDYHF